MPGTFLKKLSDCFSEKQHSNRVTKPNLPLINPILVMYVSKIIADLVLRKCNGQFSLDDFGKHQLKHLFGQTSRVNYMYLP